MPWRPSDETYLQSVQGLPILWTWCVNNPLDPDPIILPLQLSAEGYAQYAARYSQLECRSSSITLRLRTTQGPITPGEPHASFKLNIYMWADGDRRTEIGTELTEEQCKKIPGVIMTKIDNMKTVMPAGESQPGFQYSRRLTLTANTDGVMGIKRPTGYYQSTSGLNPPVGHLSWYHVACFQQFSNANYNMTINVTDLNIRHKVRWYNRTAVGLIPDMADHELTVGEQVGPDDIDAAKDALEPDFLDTHNIRYTTTGTDGMPTQDIINRATHPA